MAEPTPQSILTGLPALTFRNLDSPPYDIAPISVTHSQAERRFPYVDGAGHDHTGRDPIEINTRFYFINTLQVGAFPDLYEQWFAELMDGRPGEMLHPYLGPINARVMSFNVNADANVTLAGVIVDVTWTDSLVDPAESFEFSPLQVSAAELAAAGDQALSDAEIDFPAGGPANLADIFQQIQGLLFSTSLKVNGLINQAKGIIDSMIGIVDLANDSRLYPARDLLTQTYAATLDFEAKMGPAISRPTATISHSYSTTLSAFAGEVGNTTEEIMGLNLSLLVSPSVPASTPITYFSDVA